MKLKLIRSFCICLYDAALWCSFTVTAVNKLSSCYTKCIKSFFNYAKYGSVTAMLLELGLPSFNTLMHYYLIIPADNADSRSAEIDTRDVGAN